MNSPTAAAVSIDAAHLSENDRLDPLLHEIVCPRSVWNRTAVIYHLARAKLRLELEPIVIFAACMSYAQKECCGSTSLPALQDLRKGLDEVDVAATEALIFEYVRPHVVLIESCIRYELKSFTLHVALDQAAREPVARIALAFAQRLYECPLCLFPETCACACLLAACQMYSIAVTSDKLPAQFCSDMTNHVVNVLLSP